MTDDMMTLPKCPDWLDRLTWDNLEFISRGWVSRRLKDCTLRLTEWIQTQRGNIFHIHCQFGSVQSLSRVWLFATPWIAARQASLSITNSWSSLRLMSIESVIPSSHLILGRPLLLLPPTLRMRWPKYWSFSFSIIPPQEIPGLISFRMDWLDLLAVQGLSRVFSNTTVQKCQFFSAQPSSQSNSHIHTWPQETKNA